MDRPLRHSPAVASRAIDEEAVLVPIRRSVHQPLEVHALNPVAAFIWNHIDGQRGPEALVDLVVGEFEVGREVARADVTAFLDELAKAGLLEPAP